MNAPWLIRRSRPEDGPAVVALLRSAKLPTADIGEASGLQFWVAEANRELLGTIALEGTGQSGRLLRSLAVVATHQHRGIARALVARVEADAGAEGIGQLVLLTETAQAFFSHLGYEVIERGAAPADLRASAEFRTLCAAGAVCMRKRVGAAVADCTYNVLFLCTGNSARSILAEALLNRLGDGKFRAFSAGSYPTGTVNPMALALLRHDGMPVDGLRSKSWDEFAAPGAPRMDFIITVCDDAAGEVCPVWPGHPMIAHWGVPDPAAVTGNDSEKEKAFWTTLRTLEARIVLLVSLPIASLERLALEQHLARIGKSGAAA